MPGIVWLRQSLKNINHDKVLKNTTFKISIYHFYGLEAATSMLGQQPTQTLAATPAATPTAPTAKAPAANVATMPVDEAHHSKNMMHSNPAKRDFNIPLLDSTNRKSSRCRITTCAKTTKKFSGTKQY